MPRNAMNGALHLSAALVVLLGVSLPPVPAAARDLPRPGPSSAGATASVLADDTKPGLTIPADFVGFSLETCSTLVVCPGWQPAGGDYLEPGNAPLIKAFRWVSPNCKLRIGGNSSDFVPAPALTAQAASGLAAFLKATGCTLIYGLDAKANDPALAAGQARLVAEAVGVRNVTFQIGNEPSLPSSYPPGQRNFRRDLGDYEPLWLAYRRAILAAVPGARFMGPDDTSPDNLGAFARAVGRSSLTDLSLHIYPLKAASPVTTTVRAMLATPHLPSPQSLPPPAALTARTVAVARANGLGVRLTEFNSAYGGGLDGVTDSLASAAWIVDYGMQFATAGWASIHLHGRLTPATAAQAALRNFYTPLVQPTPGGSLSAYPIYYGMMVLARLAGGRVLPVALGNAPGQQLAAYATQAGGRTRVVAINSSDRSVTVGIDRTSGWAAGTSLLLTGSACSDTSGVTLGGGVLAGSGEWTGKPAALSPGQTVVLPPCSVVLAVLG